MGTGGAGVGGAMGTGGAGVGGAMGTGGAGVGGATGTGGAMATGPTTADVQAILNTNCIGCHSGPTPPRGLDWTSVRAQIGVPAGECAMKMRIAPGDAAHSYMVDKVLGAAQDGGCFAGVRMPAGGQPLSASDIATIVSWINNGTPL